MFHSTSHQMMRELDTGSAYRVQFKTSGGHNIDSLVKNYAHQNAVHTLEEERVTERRKELDAYGEKIAVIQAANAEHDNAVKEHQELEQTIIKKKGAADDAKKILDKHVSELQNHRPTANGVQNPLHPRSAPYFSTTPGRKL
jgi:hypothetical protein